MKITRKDPYTSLGGSYCDWSDSITGSYKAPYITTTGTTTGRITFPEVTDSYAITVKEFPIKCGQCRINVPIIESFIRDNTLIIIAHCHGDKRRIDLPLSYFRGNETDAREYLGTQIEWLFSEEAEWQHITPVKISTDNADREIVADWLDH